MEQDQQEKAGEAEGQQKDTVILIEDDPFIAQMYALKFKQTPYNLVIGHDGEEGLALISEKKPVMVLLDVILPKMDGFTILQKIKSDEATKHTPVVLLTNLGQEQDIKKGMDLGAADYIVKAHYTPQEVVQKVESILGKNKT